MDVPQQPHNPFTAVLPLYVTYEEIRRNSDTLQLMPERPERRGPEPTAIDLGHALGAKRQQFDATAQRDHLARLFASPEAHRRLAKAKKIVAFDCGSMVPKEGEEDQYRVEGQGQLTLADRALTQHALLLELRKLLSQLRRGREIPCFVQHAAYEEADKQLLESLGVTVLENPDGFLEVDESTLVFSIAAAIPVKQVVADIARPAAIVWDNLTQTEL